MKVDYIVYIIHFFTAGMQVDRKQGFTLRKCTVFSRLVVIYLALEELVDTFSSHLNSSEV